MFGREHGGLYLAIWDADELGETLRRTIADNAILVAALVSCPHQGRFLRQYASGVS